MWSSRAHIRHKEPWLGFEVRITHCVADRGGDRYRDKNRDRLIIRDRDVDRSIYTWL